MKFRNYFHLQIYKTDHPSLFVVDKLPRQLINAFLFFICILVFAAVAGTSIRVLFLPFEDKVKLKEAWDLSVDVPRWYSQTVDTIGARDTLVKTIPFDTVTAIIKRNGWKRSEYLARPIIQRMAAVCDADIVATGTVYTFKVMKRSANADGSIAAQTTFSSTTSGQGGGTAMVGLQDYTAESKMDVVLYDGKTGARIDNLSLDSKQKDGGIKIWLPIQTENDEVNFYHLSRSPFGSGYFHKNVIGAVMKSFSQRIRETVRNRQPSAVQPGDTSREFLEGKILERTGRDVYVNLGSKDNLLLGDTLEVLKPIRPVINGTDTLGWAEEAAAYVTVRSIKSNHFSQATIVSEKDSVLTGWNVRMKMNGGKP